MLKTIEVRIDARGHIHPLEALPVPYARRALLTILPPAEEEVDDRKIESVFGLLKADRPISPEEMKLAIRKRGSRL